MDTFDEFLGVFADDLPHYARAQEIYAALCNNIWRRDQDELGFTWRSAGEFVASLRNELDLPDDNPEVCQHCGALRSEHKEEKRRAPIGKILGQEFWGVVPVCPGGQGSFLPGRQGREDYLDFYCSGGEGQVTDWVEEKLLAAGWNLPSEDQKTF